MTSMKGRGKDDKRREEERDRRSGGEHKALSWGSSEADKQVERGNWIVRRVDT